MLNMTIVKKRKFKKKINQMMMMMIKNITKNKFN